MSRVWSNSKRKDGELLVMLALADFANDAGESWPSIPILAQKARLTERQTRRVVTKLEAAGEIRRVKSNGGRNRRNHYFITVTENPDTITGKELQGKNNPDIGDTKTLTPMSPALNHHRTINKSGEPKGSTSIPSHSKKRKLSPPDPVTLAAFKKFYAAYPRHVGEADALKAWIKLSPSAELVPEIMAGVARYADSVADVDPTYIKHPGPWLNARRWTDELSVGANGNGQAKSAEANKPLPEPLDYKGGHA